MVDKWILFCQWFKESEAGAHRSMDVQWNTRRLFYNIDGTLLLTTELMLADVVGTALDRRQGHASAKHCKISGAGLTKASYGQTASFTIVACSPQGIQFDDGGDTFSVHIRFAGIGTRVHARVVDNQDGSYQVMYKPLASGKCTIAVSLMGETLPGSPFSCTVSAPKPVASHCFVRGDALTKVVANRIESFWIGYRDSLSQVPMRLPCSTRAPLRAWHGVS